MNKKNLRLYPNIFNSRWYALKNTTTRIKDIMSKFIKSNDSLILADYGCGEMPYKELFMNKVKKYIGIDLEFNTLADVKILPEGKINLNDNSVDIVLSTQVLEHVENPSHYLEESFRILKNEGLLILSTHGYWIFHPDPTDYWRWTSSGLKKIISEKGFDILYFKGILARPAVGFHLLQDSLIFKVPSFLIPFIAFPFQIFIFLSDKLLATQKSRDLDAGVFMVVCRAKKHE